MDDDSDRATSQAGAGGGSEEGQIGSGASSPLTDDAGGVGGTVFWETDVADHPGCTTNETPLTEYEDTAELGEVLVGRWQSCQPNDRPGYGFEGEEAGVEFTADGEWFSLSTVDGEIVRNGSSGTWQFFPPGDFLINDLRTNAPRITLDPRSASIGVDPRFPRYVPLEE